ncbi:MAG TPA: hypothetical protein V6C85_06805 [Allocoleopsis sp.]
MAEVSHSSELLSVAIALQDALGFAASLSYRYTNAPSFTNAALA